MLAEFRADRCAEFEGMAAVRRYTLRVHSADGVELIDDQSE